MTRPYKIRALVRQPLSAASGAGITNSLSGGVLTTSLNISGLTASGPVSPSAVYIPVYVSADGTYKKTRLDEVAIPAAASRTPRGDADYNILTTDRAVALTASLTAPRVWTLPAASGIPSGAAIEVLDEAGGISATNTLTIACTGSDKINNASTLVLSSARKSVRFMCDGASKFTLIAELALNEVDTAYIKDAAVTLAKQANVATSVIMGRATAGTGVQEALTPAQARAVIGAASDTDTGVIEIATAAEVETGTSTTLALTPGRLINHPLVPKVLLYMTNGGSVTNAYSVGVSSLSRTGAGFVTVNFSTSFSNINYVALATIEGSPQRTVGVLSKGVSSLVLAVRDAGSLADTDSNVTLTIFGDQ